MPSKYYVVAVGHKPGVYTTWTEAQTQVDGFKGAVYKSFPDADQARTAFSTFTAAEFTPDEVYFVDGSSNNTGASWAFVSQSGDECFGLITDPLALQERNIAGELGAAMRAIQHALENGHKKITIVHDYLGISCYPLGLWIAKTPCSKAYVAYVARVLEQGLCIQYTYVKGHSGVVGNERADQLAGAELR